jgi:hypothetical protein
MNARALMIGARIHDPDEIDRRVAARSARQELLHREDPPQVWSIVEESALQRVIGGQEVMAAQLDSLIRANDQPNVNIQVIRNDFGAHAGLGTQFVLLDFPSELDASVAFLDTPSGELLLEKPKQLAQYNLLFQHVNAAALAPSDTSDLMRDLADQLR